MWQVRPTQATQSWEGIQVSQDYQKISWTSLTVQQLGLHAPSTGGTDPILGQGTRIPHSTWDGQNGKKKISFLPASREIFFIRAYMPGSLLSPLKTQGPHTLFPFRRKACESRSIMSDSLWTHGLYSPWNSPGQNTGVGSLSLLQGIFPTQGLNPGVPHCRRILYQLNHRGSHNGEQFKVRKSVRSHFLPGSVHRFLAIKKGCLFLVVISTQNKQKNYKPPSGRFLPLCGCQWQASLSNQLCSYNYRFGG